MFLFCLVLKSGILQLLYFSECESGSHCADCVDGQSGHSLSCLHATSFVFLTMKPKLCRLA